MANISLTRANKTPIKTAIPISPLFSITKNPKEGEPLGDRCESQTGRCTKGENITERQRLVEDRKSDTIR